MHRLQIRPIMHNQRAPPNIPPNKLHPGPCSSVGMRRGTDRQTDKHTDGRDQYTFRLGYASRDVANDVQRPVQLCSSLTLILALRCTVLSELAYSGRSSVNYQSVRRGCHARLEWRIVRYKSTTKRRQAAVGVRLPQVRPSSRRAGVQTQSTAGSRRRRAQLRRFQVRCVGDQMMTD